MNAFFTKRAWMRARVLLFSGAVSLLVSGCSLLLEDQDVTKRISMHAGSIWPMGSAMPTGLTAEEQEVMAEYFLGKELSLGVDTLKFKEPLTSVDLTLVNLGLSCGLPDDPNRQKCRISEYFNEPDKNENTTRGRCGKLMPKRQLSYVNFYGVMDHKGKNFCVYVSLYEASWPRATRIGRDVLTVTVRYEWRTGDTGAGGLAGGPRVNYRGPPLQ